MAPFGKRAGEAAARFVKNVGQGEIATSLIDEEIKTLLAPLENKTGENPFSLVEELQEAMQTDAMIARSRESLSRCLGKIAELQNRSENIHVEGNRKFNPGLHTARDVHFMLRTSEIIVRFALERNDIYFGPRLFIRLAGLDMHPMDTLSRTSQAKGEAGLTVCNITKCCTEVCPASIHITDNGIIPMKERIVDDFYDPLQSLLIKLGVLKARKRVLLQR